MSTDLEVREVEIEQTQGNLFGTSDPTEIVTKSVAIADALSEVLKQKGLIKKISGREFVVVEGWVLLGTMLGVFPVVAWSRPTLNEQGEHSGWEARVEARTLTGDVVGAAESQCTRSENLWGWHPVDSRGRKQSVRDDYALRSMAQTRAISKALRAPLGFIVTMAGYEATPADEMPETLGPSETPHEYEATSEAVAEQDARRYAIQTLDSTFQRALKTGSLPEGWSNWADYLLDHMKTKHGLQEGSDWRLFLTPEQIMETSVWLDAEQIPI